MPQGTASTWTPRVPPGPIRGPSSESRRPAAGPLASFKLGGTRSSATKPRAFRDAGDSPDSTFDPKDGPGRIQSTSQPTSLLFKPEPDQLNDSGSRGTGISLPRPSAPKPAELISLRLAARPRETSVRSSRGQRSPPQQLESRALNVVVGVPVSPALLVAVNVLAATMAHAPDAFLMIVLVSLLHPAFIA